MLMAAYTGRGRTYAELRCQLTWNTFLLEQHIFISCLYGTEKPIAVFTTASSGSSETHTLLLCPALPCDLPLKVYQLN